jgi:hypothetical protein
MQTVIARAETVVALAAARLQRRIDEHKIAHRKLRAVSFVYISNME